MRADKNGGMDFKPVLEAHHCTQDLLYHNYWSASQPQDDDYLEKYCLGITLDTTTHRPLWEGACSRRRCVSGDGNTSNAGLFGSKPPPTGISEPPEKSKKIEEVSICVY